MMARRPRKVEQPVPVAFAFTARVPVGWAQDALCGSDDGDDWYPTVYTKDGRDTATVAALKRVCARCPVALWCLVDALKEEGVRSDQHRHGIKGAMRPDERADAYRSDWKALEEDRLKRIESCGPDSGTACAVKRHRNAREDLCWPCRQYKADDRVPAADRQREAATA